MNCEFNVSYRATTSYIHNIQQMLRKLVHIPKNKTRTIFIKPDQKMVRPDRIFSDNFGPGPNLSLTKFPVRGLV